MVTSRRSLLPPMSLLDGAMGSALLARGLDLERESSAAWNLSRPEEVRGVHRAHLAAGADAIHSNTFAANRLSLARSGGGDARALNLAAMALAREEAGDRPVIGDLGPTGAAAAASEGELEFCFAEQAAWLAAGGAALLHVETLYDPAEVRAAIRGCRLGAPSLPVVISLACRRRAGGFEGVTGASLASLLAAAAAGAPDAVGCNCALTAAAMVPLVSELVAAKLGPVWAQPQAGAAAAPETVGRELAALRDAGAAAVGGCCGIGAPELRAARRARAGQVRPGGDHG